jgi:hypothetical protein
MATESGNYISICYLGEGDYGLVMVEGNDFQSSKYNILYRGKTASEMLKLAMTTFDGDHTIYIPETVNIILDLEARDLLQSLFAELSDVMSKAKTSERKPSGLGKAKKKSLGNSNDTPTPQGEDGKTE